MSKDKAAVALGKKRWADVPLEERSEQMRALAKRRAKSLTAKKRREIAAKAGRANAGKPRKPGAGRPKKTPEKKTLEP